jgi:hypothetical protein
MGSGEFDGGSSVTWKITHTDGDSGRGDQYGASGKDKHPKGPNGMFVVEVTGHPPIFASTKNTVVRVAWATRFSVCQLPPPPQRPRNRRPEGRKADASGAQEQSSEPRTEPPSAWRADSEQRNRQFVCRRIPIAGFL